MSSSPNSNFSFGFILNTISDKSNRLKNSYILNNRRIQFLLIVSLIYYIQIIQDNQVTVLKESIAEENKRLRQLKKLL